MNANGSGNDREQSAASATTARSAPIDASEFTADDSWAIARCLRSPIYDQLLELERDPIGCPIEPRRQPDAPRPR